MKRILLTLALLLGLAQLACAQYSTVSGTVTDPNGTPYYSGNLTISLSNSTGIQPTFGGNADFQQVYQMQLDTTGSFSLTLPRNDQIAPSTTQWNFQVTARGGFAGFNASATINSGSQSITATLNAAAPRISWTPGAPVSPYCAPGQLQVFIASLLAACGNGLSTGTNCNPGSSASPVACGSAASGTVVIPTTTATYTVNTTAVTTNSRILIQNITDNTGLTGAPTCTAIGTPFVAIQTAHVAATSFTFTLPSTAGATCWTYLVVN